MVQIIGLSYAQASNNYPSDNLKVSAQDLETEKSRLF